MRAVSERQARNAPSRFGSPDASCDAAAGPPLVLLPRLRDAPVEELEEFIRLSFIDALIACGREEEANEALRAAYAAVQHRASQITDPAMALAFTTQNDEARRILALAQQRLV